MRTVLPGCVLVLALAGCEPAEPAKAPVRFGAHPAEIDATAHWPFWPTSMRIHPLTRLAKDPRTGKLVIEARIELTDASDDTTKGVGQVRIDLHEVLPSGAVSPSKANWDVDLSDQKLNARHFDDVTRTYLFRLEVERALVPQQAELRAYFHGEDGREMDAAFDLPTPDGVSRDSSERDSHGEYETDRGR